MSKATTRATTPPAGLPPKPTPSQKKAAAALALTPAQQKKAWKTTSTQSPRLLETHARLDREIRRLFPTAEDTFEYNMRGWKVARRKPVADWKGTMDPNWIRIGVAERKQGITIHLWNPYDYAGLTKRKAGLEKAGYKVMVGCIQFNRVGEVPVEALGPVLDGIRKAYAAE